MVKLTGIIAIRYKIHRKGLFGVSDDRPVTIVAVDSEEKIRAVLSIVVPMVKEGLILLQDVEVISNGAAPLS